MNVNIENLATLLSVHFFLDEEVGARQFFCLYSQSFPFGFLSAFCAVTVGGRLQGRMRTGVEVTCVRIVCGHVG